MEKSDYFSDDCIVEDNIYKSLKNLLICPICKKIYNDPMICSGCQGIYCLKCLNNSCPKKCPNSKFSKSVIKNEMLSKIKYRCKNCSQEIYQSDIKSHLKTNCQYKEDNSKNTRLADLYQKKKAITRLSTIEMGQYDINEINHFTSKKKYIRYT